MIGKLWLTTNNFLLYNIHHSYSLNGNFHHSYSLWNVDGGLLDKRILYHLLQVHHIAQSV